MRQDPTCRRTAELERSELALALELLHDLRRRGLAHITQPVERLRRLALEPFGACDRGVARVAIELIRAEVRAARFVDSRCCETVCLLDAESALCTLFVARFAQREQVIARRQAA